ncbi:MAG: hypothetical protein FWH36_06125 [Lentimicrobiaceae bacterium]|nr:hypothetical protein [Lentimicrobiaceae bacterium]
MRYKHGRLRPYNTDACVHTTRTPASIQHGRLRPYNTDACVHATRTQAY